MVLAFGGGVVVGWLVKPTPEAPTTESWEVTVRTFEVRGVIDGDTFNVEW